jgi:hypothetical protein
VDIVSILKSGPEKLGRNGPKGPARSDDRNRANRGGNEQAAGEDGTDDRNGQLLKVERNRHCLSPELGLPGHSVSHASSFAAAVPSSENGGNPPFLEVGACAPDICTPKKRRVSPTFGVRIRTLCPISGKGAQSSAGS